MRFSTLITQALGSIYANKGRSTLTALGIVIGIASVIALLGIGTGVSNSVEERVSKFSSNNITIRGQEISEDEVETPAGAFGPPEEIRNLALVPEPTLTKSDLEIIAGVEDIVATSPVVSESTKLEINEVSERLKIKGISEQYGSIEEKELNTGREISIKDINDQAQIAVIGSEIAKDFYTSAEDALGKSILIKDISYEIVGVYGQAEASELPGNFDNPDEDIYLPYTTALALFEAEAFGTIIAQASSENTVQKATETIEARLLEERGVSSLDEADFQTSTSQDLLDALNDVTTLLTSLLTGIAAISLLVGGIGIMNIMLVSVSERTKEIGLRKAVGAKTRHVLWQFLSESVVLTLIGGVIGIFLGRIMSNIIGELLDIEVSITTNAVLLAVCVASLTGIIFGIYPAYKAAKLDPIDALRHE
jgi:putative ABC transport system permease protein